MSDLQTLTQRFLILSFLGLDAIGRVLKKAKKEGTRGLGHSYKKSIGGDFNAETDEPAQV